MAFTYEQRTGRFLDPNGDLLTIGYSGYGDHRNKPESEALAGLGPLPRGRYRIGDETDSATRGPCVLPLAPIGHDAHGRSAFLIHGDSREHPGLASHGCIILPRPVRELVADSDDDELVVVEPRADEPAVTR